MEGCTVAHVCLPADLRQALMQLLELAFLVLHFTHPDTAAV